MPLLLSLVMEPKPVSGSGSSGVPTPITSHTTIAVTASPPPLDGEDDDHHPDSSLVGSPDFHEDLPHSDQPHPSSDAALSDDLRLNIIKQVEYYFSHENLPSNKHLLKYVTNNEEGFVPLNVIASFKKMKKLTKEIPLIVTTLMDSSLLVVSSDEKGVNRLNPLPYIDIGDPQLCTVSMENLLVDHSVENLRKLFSLAGPINHISIREPHAERNPKKCTIAGHFDTVEAAEKAVATLNDEHDWRFGLRVKLFKKETKRGHKKKVQRELDFDRHTYGQSSDQAVDQKNLHLSKHHGDSYDEKDGDPLLKETIGEHAPKDKNGHAGRNRGLGRGEKHGTNVPAHGIHPSAHVTEPSKLPPSPRMSDGTRGFTMGQGQTLVTNLV